MKFSIESMNSQELHGYMMSGIKMKDTKILTSDITFVELPDIFDELDMPTDQSFNDLYQIVKYLAIKNSKGADPEQKPIDLSKYKSKMSKYLKN